MKRLLKGMYTALVEEAEEKARSTGNDHMQTMLLSVRRDLPRLTAADVEMLNDYLFDNQPMIWSKKDGFQPGSIR